MPVVSVYLSDTAYEAYKTMPKGTRSKRISQLVVENYSRRTRFKTDTKNMPNWEGGTNQDLWNHAQDTARENAELKRIVFQRSGEEE